MRYCLCSNWEFISQWSEEFGLGQGAGNLFGCPTR